MNCANHPEVASAAFCRTCGKPLCATCTRDVRGVIYCENCLAARLEGTVPQQTVYQQVMDQGLGLKVPPSPGPGPNAGLAGVLAGFFPFGVGAVYCGQYAKGLAHLLIFSGLIWGVSTANDNIAPVLGIAIGFFYLYQIIDAVRSARAVQMGQPAPDPFGLASTFSVGEKVDTSKVPVGAFLLIGLGVLFLLHTMGLWFFSFGRVAPFVLIAFGGWLFARRWGWIGPTQAACGCERCRMRCILGPVIMLTIGLLWLVSDVRPIGFFTWVGAILIVIGGVKVLESGASDAGHISSPPPDTTTTVTTEVQPPSSEVRHG